jgi:transposase InsO family protein
MPWKILSAVGERWRFAQAALKQLKSFTALCHAFGISRQCGYKWLRRFHQDGRSGLHNHSRRPRRSPQRTSARWRQAVRRLRQRFPHWGAKKIHARLHRKFPRARLPAVRTITKWLPRLCPMRRRQRHSRRGPRLPLPPLTLSAAPNDVWTVDFKGFFHTADGTRCDPLTVRDLFSRLLLAVRILPHQRQAAVRRVFIGLFRRYGLPKVIRMDNGSPFGSTGAWGLSALSVWWLILGIRVEFIRPGHPEENGAHEQMHRELKRDTARPPAAHPLGQQRRSDRWRRYYNTERPHEALGGRYPSDCCRHSRRRYRGPQPIRYPRGWVVRHVRHNGQIKWQGRMRSIGEAFVGQPIALRRQSAGIYEIYFQQLLLGTLHDRDAGGIRPSKPRRLKT